MLVPERIDALFSPTLLFIPAGTPESTIVSTIVQSLQQGLGLHDIGMFPRAIIKGINSGFKALFIIMHQQVEVVFGAECIPKFNHLPELPGGVNMQQLEGHPTRIEGFLGQPYHDRGVFADRV